MIRHRERPRRARGAAVPGISKLGGLVIAFGLVWDLAEHGSRSTAAVLEAVPASTHLAHAVVLLGMVLVLVGVVADGVRSSRRHVRQKESGRHAVR